MNHQSSIHKRNDQLSLDDLRAYQAGQLSGPAQHRVERLMLENPFYADALDGLDALQQVGGSLKAQTRDLHTALQERIHESATTRRLMPLWVTSLAASVLLVLSVAVYLIFTSTNPTQKATQVAAPSHYEPGTVLIDPKDLGTLPSTKATVSAPQVRVSAVRRVKKAPYQVRTRQILDTDRLAGSVLFPAKPDVPDDILEASQLPRLPMLESERIDRRTINTERAFNNWPPGANGTMRRW